MGWNEVGVVTYSGNISYSNLLQINFSFATKREENKKKEIKEKENN